MAPLAWIWGRIWSPRFGRFDRYGRGRWRYYDGLGSVAAERREAVGGVSHGVICEAGPFVWLWVDEADCGS